MASVTSSFIEFYGSGPEIPREEIINSLTTKMANHTVETAVAPLYDAISGFRFGGIEAGAQRFSERASSADYHNLALYANIAKNRTYNQNLRVILQALETLSENYKKLLDPALYSADTPININKSSQLGSTSHARPKHSLLRIGPYLFESLTWMSPAEEKRFLERFKQFDGLLNINYEKERTIRWNGREIKERKINLGAGAFGFVRVAREVYSDTYVALKKTHPKPGNNSASSEPKAIELISRLNDGSTAHAAKVYASFLARSTRSGNTSNKLTAYTFVELGVMDVQVFLDYLVLLRYCFEGVNASNFNNQPKLIQQVISVMANEYQDQLIAAGRSAADAKAIALSRFLSDSNPFFDRIKFNRFLNTIAYQMTLGINAFHNAGKAHNDIKPDNFVIATHGNRIAIKVIDYDFASNHHMNVGVPRDVYAWMFSAPQVSSTESNNSPFLNDAYSLGLTFSQVFGHTTDHLINMRRAQGKAEGTKQEKLVEDRRKVDALLEHFIEYTNLDTISDGMCHPWASKRLSVSDLLKSGYFDQTDRVMQDLEFSEIMQRIIRWMHLTPIHAIKPTNLAQQASNVEEKVFLDLIDQLSTLISNDQVSKISRINVSQFREIYKEYLKRKLGPDIYRGKKNKAESDYTKERIAAAGRAFFRTIANPSRLTQTPDQLDSTYSFGSRRK